MSTNINTKKALTTYQCRTWGLHSNLTTSTHDPRPFYLQAADSKSMNHICMLWVSSWRNLWDREAWQNDLFACIKSMIDLTPTKNLELLKKSEVLSTKCSLKVYRLILSFQYCSRPAISIHSFNEFELDYWCIELDPYISREESLKLIGILDHSNDNCEQVSSLSMLDPDLRDWFHSRGWQKSVLMEF